MRWLSLLVLACVCAAGCSRSTLTSTPPSSKGGGTRPVTSSTNAPKEIVTPGGVLPGKVLLVNPTARFVVLSFPMGSVPGADQRLSVYREGLKVAEIKVTSYKRDQYTVGDIISGECRVGDEVKPE